MNNHRFIHYLLLVIAGCLFCLQLSAQNFGLDSSFGKFSKEETEMTRCDFEPDAEAVILLDKSHTLHGITDRTCRRVRLKILTAAGIPYGNISLPFYSKHGFYRLDTIRAVIANKSPNGNYYVTELEHALFYLQSEPGIKYVKFALPDVKAGSIIEFEYIISLKNMHYMEDWSFQSSIPTLKSIYRINPCPQLELTFAICKNPQYPHINEITKDSGIYFEMNHIPSLKTEPYMDAPGDYLQRVTFQVSMIKDIWGYRTAKLSTWKQVASSFLRDFELKKQLNKNLHNKNELKELLHHTDDAEKKVRIIYNYVKENVSWDGRYSLLPEDGLKDVWQKKRGSSAEVNCLLINLLKDFNIEAYPLLVAERDYGKVDISYPFLEQFNNLAVFAKTEKKQFILDATEKNGYIDLIPFQLLNTNAFLLDLKQFEPVAILANDKSFESIIKATGNIDSSGNYQGNINIKSWGYAKQLRTTYLKENNEEYKKNFFTGDDISAEAGNYEVMNLETDTLPLEMKATIKSKYEQNGGYYLYNYNHFMGLKENPFTRSTRVTNVNFGYPNHILLEESIKIPENYVIENTPDNSSLSFLDGSTRFTRSFRIENNTAYIRIELIRSHIIVKREDYAELKDFYAEITKMLSEPLLIKHR